MKPKTTSQKGKKEYQIKLWDNGDHTWIDLDGPGTESVNLKTAKEMCDKKNLKEFRDVRGNGYGDHYGVIRMRNRHRGTRIYPTPYR